IGDAAAPAGYKDEMSLANVKIFNADLSEFSFCYGVSDFLEGRREPDVLLNGISRNTDYNLGATTSGGWSGSTGTKGSWVAGSYLSYIYNADLSGDADAASFGIENAVDFATTVDGSSTSSPMGGLYNKVLNLKYFAGETISIHLSFYAKRLINSDNTSLGLFLTHAPGSGSSILLKRLSSSQLPHNQWVKVDETLTFEVPNYPSTENAYIGWLGARANSSQAGGSFRMANFVFEIAGAVASFGSCANSNELKDMSLNNNDAIASGGVKFGESANPAHCREFLSWAGTMATQEGAVEIPKNSAVKIYAKSSSAVSVSASVNSVSKTANLPADVLAEIGEWIASSGGNAEFAPSAIFTGKIDIFYKIERL
ncbi:MAG: hypothetical protein IKO42_07975, partial [Opitutales bacterium]|nr:hypothetical protein [Opitutales bacterium]